LYDVGEASAVEKDSMVLIGVHSDEDMRQSKEINLKVLKGRDGGADSSPQGSYYDPAFTLIASTSALGGGNAVAASDVDDIFGDW